MRMTVPPDQASHRISRLTKTSFLSCWLARRFHIGDEFFDVGVGQIAVAKGDPRLLNVGSTPALRWLSLPARHDELMTACPDGPPPAQEEIDEICRVYNQKAGRRAAAERSEGQRCQDPTSPRPA
jgi:hypothetical protein